ncbi:hypothetical protein DXT99_18145 [Pontibacter diazotrophicus]|uniref:PA14 domain-containing protein n=1 Tax=Pontibacter diazotrophicus TaxID=1400979 RepID=A0A3D8L8D4_9BACT|nr:PA14 domain-containing protein [Pontibacter diazotrophicus]RDV13691.1 hypothetical protein DXT99_18145 [Pontibacter diazotrophicus]
MHTTISSLTKEACPRVLILLLTYALFAFLPSNVIAQSYSGPIVIKKGGTYKGNWESKNSEVAAVEIQTSEPVIIENSNIKGAGYLIKAWGYSVNLTVRHTNGYGLTPTPYKDYKKPRRFVTVNNFKNLVVENCYMESTAGIYVGVRYEGNGSSSETIRIRYNIAKNIDGRVYGGAREHSQFTQFNFRGSISNAEIAWNQVVNEPDKSLVEDNINLSNARGTSGSPIKIHNNYIQGAHPYPATSSTFSGGGIIADSWYQDGMGDPNAIATAYVKIYNNQTVNLSNYNYAIAGGNNIEIYNNRAITSALLSDGTPVNTHNIGFYGYDYYKKKVTHNNAVHDNLIGVMATGAQNLYNQNYFPDGTVGNYNNTFMSGKVTKQHEKDEYTMWQNKLSKNGIVLGPNGAASTSPANQAPSVAIASPSADSGFEEGSAITIQANANDNDGSIAKVEFYEGSTKIGEDTSAPYSFNWQNAAQGAYSLTAKAHDNDGATNVSAAVRVSVAGKSQEPTTTTPTLTETGTTSGTGKITREYWNNVHGDNITVIPVANTPKSVTELTSFEAPANIGDNYGQRIRGYVTAPVSGQYTFWIAADDIAELYLSTDESSSRKKKIAYVSNWTNSREWNKHSGQQSAKITLEAGKRYYIEALHLEGGGGDNLAVGWQLPSGAKEMPIAGNRLSTPGSTAPTTIITTPTAGATSTGKITREYWSSVEGSDISNVPVTDTPNRITELTSFEAPANEGTNSAQRIRGYVTAPSSGQYTFWIAGDDDAELWLSTDENPDNKKKIASVNGWTSSRQWDKFSSQKSASVRLEAGKRYYIEALHKQGWGGSNLAVAWQLSGGKMEAPIAGKHLSPITEKLASTSTNAITKAATSEPFFEKATAYPNPFQDIITLNLGGQEVALQEVVLLNQTGKVVYRAERLELTNNSLEINLSGVSLPIGLYILKYTDTAGSSKSIKIIKK